MRRDRLVHYLLEIPLCLIEGTVLCHFLDPCQDHARIVFLKLRAAEELGLLQAALAFKRENRRALRLQR